MRKVKRLKLNAHEKKYLLKREKSVIVRHNNNTLDIESEWKSARQTKTMNSVFLVLKRMMGVRERCMYCVDSHGSDIEHFRPKAKYHRYAFSWSNLLLCCTECGRLKGSQFPLSNRSPLLINPTKQDPWDHIDFDPVTGNLTARFNMLDNIWSPIGVKTVEVLWLDRREAMAAGYLATFKRLSKVVSDFLANANVTPPPQLLEQLKQEDDHGLIGWCFGPSGQSELPFSDLYSNHLAVWNYCKNSA